VAWPVILPLFKKRGVNDEAHPHFLSYLAMRNGLFGHVSIGKGLKGGKGEKTAGFGMKEGGKGRVMDGLYSSEVKGGGGEGGESDHAFEKGKSRNIGGRKGKSFCWPEEGSVQFCFTLLSSIKREERKRGTCG